MSIKQFNFEQGETLLVDKPVGWTSFDVVKKIRNACQVKKVGHAGTLDPLATGLLVICTGKKTKLLTEYTGNDKEYTGAFYLGATTPSYDLETEVNATWDISHITAENIKEATKQFLGEISQVPPMYSAITVDGKRLYELARKGKEAVIEPRQVSIHEFEITEIALPLVHFRVLCSKGTYIRSLAFDFGKALGVGAYLQSLRRTKSGNLDVEHAYALDDLIIQIKEWRENAG